MVVQKILDLPDLAAEDVGEGQTLRQEASSLQQFMKDAEQAHKQLKESLLPGTEWARKPEKIVYKDKRKKPPPPPSLEHPNCLQSEAGHRPFSEAHHRDEGWFTLQRVEEQVLATKRHFDAEPFRSLVNASSLEVAFESAEQLYAAAVEFKESMKDDIVMFKNEMRNPTCLGCRGLCFFVRQRLADPGGLRRMHICELRLSLKAFEDARREAQAACAETLKEILTGEQLGCPEAAVAEVNAIWRIALWVFELTHGRAKTHASLEYVLVPPILDMPHDHEYNK